MTNAHELAKRLDEIATNWSSVIRPVEGAPRPPILTLLDLSAEAAALLREQAGRVEELEEIRDAILASTSEQWIHDLYDEERPG